MDDVKLELNEKGKGEFYIEEGDRKVGQMIIDVSGMDLTVYHTEVVPEFEGKGLANRLLNAMVHYARNNGLKVIALCPFVHAAFSRHRGQYGDIWKNKKN